MLFDTQIAKDKYDMLFVLIFSLNEFSFFLKKVIEQNLLNPNGLLYFAYPKKGNKQYSLYIGRDDFFGVAEMDNNGYVFNSPLKFNKMAAFSEVFTVIGLKHEEKQKKQTTQRSQCVADYIERIPDVRNHFEKDKDILTLFDQLTPGYQRGWARYVYSTKNESTTQKRFLEMETILKQGYKSVDLFRETKKNEIKNCYINI